MSCPDVLRRSALALSVATAISLSIGCSSEPDRYTVSGSVAFAGQPVPAGDVVFMPQGGGVVGRAVIKNGQLEMTDKKVAGGSYRLVISGFDGVPYEGPEFTVQQGKEIFPAVEATVDLPADDCSLRIEVAEAGRRQVTAAATVE
ncbi:MAG: hypothetical protein KDA61_03135 [Planctomycetales bacterium]|nr:hypothetical protein [Planctomycetales bacterium]